MLFRSALTVRLRFRLQTCSVSRGVTRTDNVGGWDCFSTLDSAVNGPSSARLNAVRVAASLSFIFAALAVVPLVQLFRLQVKQLNSASGGDADSMDKQDAAAERLSRLSGLLSLLVAPCALLAVALWAVESGRPQLFGACW